MTDQDTRVAMREPESPEPSTLDVEAVEPASMPLPASPAPVASPEQEGGKPPPPAVPDPQAENTARYRRRVLLVLLAIVLALGLYWASGYVFAYTDDAYVTSDLVGVAPQVSGRIVAVHVVDNQT